MFSTMYKISKLYKKIIIFIIKIENAMPTLTNEITKLMTDGIVTCF